MGLQPLLEQKIKKNKFLLKLFQQQVSHMDYISPIYRVRRKELESKENKKNKKIEGLIASLNNNAGNFRLK